MRWLKRLAGRLLVILVVGFVAAIYTPWGNQALLGLLHGESFYRGRPSSYWSSRLRDGGAKQTLETLAILQHGAADAVPVIVECMETVQVHATAWDLQQILKQQGRAVVPALADVVAQHPNAVVRYDACKTLAAMGPEARDALSVLLYAALNDPDKSARFMAGVAVQWIDEEAAKRAGVPIPR